MASVPHHRRLTRISSPLHPAQAPYYIDSADRRHRAIGWYWRPAGVDHPAFLGHNHIVAEWTLTELLDRQEAHAA